MPKVSVIMGVHNGAKTIVRSIESIQKQTFTDWEFIICDDASKDGTYDLLCGIASKDSRIRVIKNEQNQGLSFTLNRCISESSGEYLARMDDDDISHTNRLECQVRFLDSNQQYDIVGCNRRTFDEKGVWNTFNDEGELSKHDIISGHIFTHPTVMMRKSAVDQVGGYTVSDRTMRGQDFDMWCKMYANGSVGYIMRDVLFDYFEDRNRLKEVRFRFRYNNFKTHMIWRKRMGLPVWDDVYAWKEIIAGIIPQCLLVAYKKKFQGR